MKSTSGKIKVQRGCLGFYVGSYTSEKFETTFDIFVKKIGREYFAEVKQDKDIKTIFGESSIKKCLDRLEWKFIFRGY